VHLIDQPHHIMKRLILVFALASIPTIPSRSEASAIWVRVDLREQLRPWVGKTVNLESWIAEKPYFRNVKLAEIASDHIRLTGSDKTTLLIPFSSIILVRLVGAQAYIAIR
jgi:hypothetical protein